MLHPGKVGVSRRRCSVLPAPVFSQQVAAPVAVIKWRIRDHKVRLQILVGIVQERSLRVPANIRAINAPNRQVYPAQLVGGLVALLPINGNVIQPPLMIFDELLALNEHSSRTTARVEHSPLVGFEYFHQYSHYALGRIELSPLATFGEGELSQEVLEHLPQQVRLPGWFSLSLQH